MFSLTNNEVLYIALLLTALGFIALALKGIAYLLVQGWQEIPAGSATSPPFVGVPTFFGRPQYDRLIESGWHYFFGYPLIRGFIPVPVGEFNDTKEVEVILPDGTPVKQPLGWTLLVDKKDPDAVRHFIESGGEAGVKEQAREMITERGKEFLASKEQGPGRYREAQGIQEEMGAVLFRRIVDLEDVPPIQLETESKPFPVPTPVLLKYFNVSLKSPSECEAKPWGRKDPKNKSASEWEILDEIVGNLTDEELASLKRQVSERRRVIQETRDGRGTHRKRGLGVILRRLNIGEVLPTDPEMVKAIQKKSVEKELKEAEAITMQFARDEIKKTGDDLGVSKETSGKWFQTERGKVVKTISETEFSASEGLLKALPEVIREVAKALRGDKEEGDKKEKVDG